MNLQSLRYCVISSIEERKAATAHARCGDDSANAHWRYASRAQLARSATCRTIVPVPGERDDRDARADAHRLRRRLDRRSAVFRRVGRIRLQRRHRALRHGDASRDARLATASRRRVDVAGDRVDRRRRGAAIPDAATRASTCRAIFRSARDSADRRPRALRPSRRSRRRAARSMNPHRARRTQPRDRDRRSRNRRRAAGSLRRGVRRRARACASLRERVDVRDDSAGAQTRDASSSDAASSIYTGQSRISGETIDAVLDAYRAPRAARAERARGKCARSPSEWPTRSRRATSTRSRRSSREQWMHQRSLHPAIPTPLIDEIIARGAKRPARSARKRSARRAADACCVIARDGSRATQVRRRRSRRSANCCPFTIDEHGVERCL